MGVRKTAKAKKMFRKTRSKRGGTSKNLKRGRTLTHSSIKSAIRKTPSRKTKKRKRLTFKTSPITIKSPKVCSICLEQLKNTDKIPSLKCGHEFHKDCLAGLCHSQQNMDVKCPLCRADIGSVCTEINPQTYFDSEDEQSPTSVDRMPRLRMSDL
jgi:hypothetical protein